MSVVENLTNARLTAGEVDKKFSIFPISNISSNPVFVEG
jgi:hypothetical protein